MEPLSYVRKGGLIRHSPFVHLHNRRPRPLGRGRGFAEVTSQLAREDSQSTFDSEKVCSSRAPPQSLESQKRRINCEKLACLHSSSKDCGHNFLSLDCHSTVAGYPYLLSTRNSSSSLSTDHSQLEES
eukprot:5840984-Amphidinium_carterae.1